jgi:hypothetical protein
MRPRFSALSPKWCVIYWGKRLYSDVPALLINIYYVYKGCCSLIAARIVSTAGALVSLPDSSMNILQENRLNAVF